MKKILNWGGNALLVLIVIGFISSMGGDSSQSESSNKASGVDRAQQVQTVYQVGEPITSKKVELMVNGVEYSSDLGKTSIYATENKLDSKVLSDLNPGITVKDAKVFELGKEAFQAGGWTLVVQAEGESFRVPIN